MKPEDMIKLNNEKRKLLTEENELSYSNILVYIRCSNVPEQQTEELLLEILEHLLEAQKEGKTAYDVFGDNLQSYCDELINALPQQTMFEKFSNIGFMISLLLAIQFGIDTISAIIISISPKQHQFHGLSFDVLDILLCVTILTVGIYIILYILKGFSFNVEMNWKRRITFGLAVSIPFGSVVLLHIFFKKHPYLTYNISIWQGALVACFFYILYKFLFKASRF
ncbi:hypothetical protein S2E19_01701 [Bacillus mycoides]|uniref:DUF1129 family protein n=1 Tax=Bacillus mycoides TaxID=1405 RepID=UPI000A27AFF8|nr:DUF1129 family protein [Bacillus mycoides]OSY04367.1 hypothetical protein S2E19_01701 [Bacillus mycoides]